MIIEVNQDPKLPLRLKINVSHPFKVLVSQELMKNGQNAS